MAGLGRSSLLKIQELMKDFGTEAKRQSDINLNKFSRVDSYLEKTSDLSKDTRQGETSQLAGEKKLVNVEIPIMHIKKETAHANLVGTFCTGYPIFQATSNREHEDGAAMLNTLTGRDQQRLGWVSEVSRSLDDVLRRNVCAVEVSWVTRRAAGVNTNIVAGVTKTGAITPIIYEGVQLKRLDPYNTFIDPLVEPAKAHIDGNFIGYVEVADLVTIKRKYLDLDATWTYKENIAAIMSGTCGAGSGYTKIYKVPQVSKTEQAPDPTNFSGYFGSVGTSSNMVAGKHAYEVFTLYRRMIPEDFDISSKQLPNAGSPYVFKLIWINGHLCYAEPLTLGTEYLPIAVGQMYPGNVTKKSFCEYLLDLQDLGTGLMTATLSSLRRAVADRALYDPSRIKKEDVNSPNPAAKIPVTGNMFQKGLGDAYYQIPFTDNVSGNMQGMMQTVFALADMTTGINPSSQGSFIPGNKTVQEFNTIMSNSDSRLQLGALILSATFFQAIKEMVKTLYLVNAINEDIYDQQANTTVKVDMAVLREQAPDYMMADGLLPATKLANTAVMTQAMVTLQNNPMLSMEYDTGAILLSILKQQGFNNINQYKRTPEQAAQYMQMMGALNGTQQPAGQSGQPADQPTGA